MDDDCLPVVVGVDGSHSALNAAQWAVAEAVSRGARLRLVYAQSDSTGGAMASGGTRRALDAACAAVTACSPTVPVETVCLPGCSERVLVEESKDASMVCIGAHGRCGVPLGPTATALGQDARCSVAIIRECEADSTGVIAVVLDDAPDNDAVVHQAMKEGRMRKATVRQIDRRTNSWVRRFPDVHVEIVAAGCGPHGGYPPESALPQLAVVGRADARRTTHRRYRESELPSHRRLSGLFGAPRSQLTTRVLTGRPGIAAEGVTPRAWHQSLGGACHRKRLQPK